MNQYGRRGDEEEYAHPWAPLAPRARHICTTGRVSDSLEVKDGGLRRTGSVGEDFTISFEIAQEGVDELTALSI